MNFTLETAALATLIAFFANIILCPIVIPLLKRIKFGQNVRDDGPKSHIQKSGTPTMGGVIILISFLISSSIFVRDNLEGRLVIFVTIGFGLIGFLDDYIKVVMKRSLGLKAVQKLILQLIVSSVFLFVLMQNNNTDNSFTQFLLPFMGGATIELGVFFIPVAIFIIIGTVNSVNLTDGLDGLASGVTALVATFFIFISWAMGSSVLPITGAAVGSLLAFLLFNTYPARVFMGDTGSLALGGFIVAVAIILRMPLFLAIVGFVYVAESLSVILQVAYFKITKGKRLFRMSPLHHHFELLGFPETKVVAAFYIATTTLCLIGFLATYNMF